MSLTYAVIGTGALGGFYGARLQRAGCEVHFLLRSDYNQVCDRGLKVESPEGNFQLTTVHAYPQAQQMPPCDVVILALKTTQNQLLSDLLPPVLKADGVVLVLQNGLGVEPFVANLVGNDRVMGGLCFLCANKVGPGHIRHLDYGAITLGEFAADYQAQGLTERMHRIAADFRQAKIPITLSDDLLLARWRKLVWNIPFNGLSVVLNAQVDALIQHPSTRQLAQQLMQEVVQIAASQNRVIPDQFVQTMLVDTETMKPYRTSMKLDFDLKRPMELETMYDQPLQVAEKTGVAAPQITMLYQQLQFLESKHPSQNSD
jgi:2-dehydropantoate 2-reductase